MKVIYDVGCFKGQWYKQRKKTFPEAEYFYLFDAQNLISSELLKDKAKFFNVVLGSIEGEQVSFWQDGGSGSSYFKELGNTLWNNVEPEIVNTKTLKALINENSLKKPNYLKIDTQSSEIEILKGLGNYQPLFIKVETHIFSMYKNVSGWNKVLDYLYDLNYIAIDWKPIGSHATRIPAEMDMMFIPNFNNNSGANIIKSNKEKNKKYILKKKFI